MNYAYCYKFSFQCLLLPIHLRIFIANVHKTSVFNECQTIITLFMSSAWEYTKEQKNLEKLLNLWS